MKPQPRPTLQILAGIAILLLAGCTQSPPGQVDVTYGLGLVVPSPLPPRGPFLEGQASVNDLWMKLNQTVPRVLESCGEHFTDDQIREAMESDLLYASVYAVYNACQKDVRAEAKEIAKQARRDGTETITYEKYLALAAAAVDRQARLLDNISRGATVAEVEMVSKLMAQHTGFILGLDTAKAGMDYYLNVSQDELALVNIYAGLLHKDEPVTRTFIATYPWSSSSCHVPDQVQLEQRIAEKLQTGLALGRKWEKPGDADLISRPYGALLKGHAPLVAYASERDWWQLLLRLEMELDDIIGFYATYETSVLPTQEEAQYLVAKYWNESRSLVIQDRLDSLASQMRYSGRGWGEDDPRPRMALGLEKMHWAYAQVTCD